jgi:hypothetical protein
MKKSPKWFTERVVQIVENPELHQPWGKAWGGRLNHFWLSDRETLCGKTGMYRHLYEWTHKRADRRCGVCEKRAKQAKEVIE